jgi:hypothetical protein
MVQKWFCQNFDKTLVRSSGWLNTLAVPERGQVGWCWLNWASAGHHFLEYFTGRGENSLFSGERKFH